MDNAKETLSGQLNGAAVRQLAKEMPTSMLLEFLFEEEERIARNAAWILTHKSVKEIRTLPHDRLADFAMHTHNSSLRRLSLNLIEQQKRVGGEIRTDFLDFCLQHMVMPDEPPGVQSLCIKLAYRMCLRYPELLHEFEETLKLMPSEHYKTCVKHLRKQLLDNIQPF